MRKLFEITFLWPNGNWTWIQETASDFHDVMLVALLQCPREARVLRIEPMPSRPVVELGPLLDDVDELGSEG